jgi:RHS repeat-associated protein
MLRSPTQSGGTGSGTDTGATVYSFQGGYDAVSNLTSYADSVMGTWTFTPDTLNRLVTSHNTAVTSTSTQFSGDYGCWIYDAFGNRLSQSMSTTACTSSPPLTSWAQYNGTVNGTNNNQMSQTNQDTAQAGGYDAGGNITNDGVNQYLYDAEGRICAVASTPVPGITTMTGYLYDAEGTRVAKGSITAWSCDPSLSGFATTNDYVLGPSGEQVTEMTVSGSTSAWAHTNVFAGRMLLATYDATGAGLHFYLSDPLGTRRVQTGYNGELEQTCPSLPFGDDLTCSGSATTPTEHHFTGKERDTESGNDYFGARYYASSMGRFTAPDDGSDQDPSDPQSWNLYSYVRNNPLTHTDSDGRSVMSARMMRAEVSIAHS